MSKVDKYDVNMKRIHIFVLITLLLIIISCGRNQEKLPTLVLHPHEEVSGSVDLKSYKSVFLAGTIDMGNSVDWQAEAADFFENSRGSWILFNPRQGAWDPNKKDEMDYQVNWELEHLEDADYILMNILPDSKSPITLLELGLFAKSGKLYVVCTEGFYRYDNVRITCAKYGVPVYASLTEAIRGIISSSSMRGMSSLHSRTVNALQPIKIIPSMSADIPSAQA